MVSRLKFRTALAALAALALSPLVLDAVLVAPHAIFMDHRTRTAQFTIANPGSAPEDVEIALRFGYPDTDSNGNPYIVLVNDPAPGQPSAAAWIQAFPRRIRLEPGQRQVVRLLANPPADLPDGEYWTRVIATSRRLTSPTEAGASGLQAGLTFELRTIVGLIYRKGTPHTAVRMRQLTGALQGDSVVIWAGLEREGNAAYLGSAHVSLVSGTGAQVQEWRVPIAVYYTLHRRLAFPVANLAPGSYLVRVEFTTAREDVAQADVLPAPAVVDSFAIDVH